MASGVDFESCNKFTVACEINCSRVFESISLYENLSYSTSMVKGYGRQCSLGGGGACRAPGRWKRRMGSRMWKRRRKWCFTLMFQILVYCSFQQHLRTVKATASLVGKDIEIFFQQRNIANIFEP